jgi:archaellum component FlaC
MNLREIIKKNNSTYTVKVEALTNELESLRQENESLHAEIHDLRSWNLKLRNGNSASMDENFHYQIDELASRVNQVTGYLIALSLTMESSEQDSNHVGRGGDPESYFSSLTKKESAREELREAVLQRRESLLASDDRDDIIQMASDIESEIRSSSINSRKKFLSDQREELRSISTTLKSLR